MVNLTFRYVPSFGPRLPGVGPGSSATQQKFPTFLY